MFHPWTLPPTVLCHWATALSVTRAAKRLFPSAGSPFPSRPFLSQDPGVFCLGTTADIRTGPFQHNITSIDRHTGCRIWQVVIKTCGNLCFILHIGSPGCQRHGWTLHPHVSTCFEQEVRYFDRDRDTPQNYGSWISRELSWKNLIFQILIHQNMPHWTATIYCDCRWKTVFKTVVTSAEAPSLCRSWRPPKPSLPTAAWRSPRSHFLLQNAAESNLSTAEVGGTTCCSSRRLLSSRAAAVPDVHGRALRQEKGDDRRVVVPCCPVQRGPAVRPREVGEELVEAAPVAAQVAPHRRPVAAARRFGDVVISARGEMQQKWSSSVPLIFMFYLL